MSVPPRPASRLLRIAAGGVVLLVLASVSVHCGRTLQIVDGYGRTVPGALVAYRYEGSRPNPVHPVSYRATALSLAQSDGDGRVRIPASVHVHLPFPIETHPGVVVDLVYAPSLHNGLATIRDRATMRPGEYEVADDLATVRLVDVSERPEVWQGTLMNVSSVIDQLLAERTYQRPRRPPSSATTELTRVLIDRFSTEYLQFVDRHGQVARERPEMPPLVRSTTIESERRAWEEMVEKDLTVDPTWGHLARRLFARNVDRFGEALSTLR